MGYKFENLDVWKLSLEYVDLIYEIIALLPKSEQYNLADQMKRAATSVSLNIAEGSTGQSDAEQARFLNMASRSLIETVACQHLIYRRGYLKDVDKLRLAYTKSRELFAKIQAFKQYLKTTIKEDSAEYTLADTNPFY